MNMNEIDNRYLNLSERELLAELRAVRVIVQQELELEREGSERVAIGLDRRNLVEDLRDTPVRFIEDEGREAFDNDGFYREDLDVRAEWRRTRPQFYEMMADQVNNGLGLSRACAQIIRRMYRQLRITPNTDMGVFEAYFTNLAEHGDPYDRFERGIYTRYCAPTNRLAAIEREYENIGAAATAGIRLARHAYTHGPGEEAREREIRRGGRVEPEIQQANRPLAVPANNNGGRGVGRGRVGPEIQANRPLAIQGNNNENIIGQLNRLQHDLQQQTNTNQFSR
jgi:hypothetical protein